ncbi:MAG: ABC transporter ATP-binding protein [Anaerolineales bacterium]|jgi:fluoroquinolone transport system ATP-binding protein
MIRVEQLSYTYPHAAAPAVRDLTFEIAQGEIFGFLGPSGAGKSTSQKILIGLLRGYQGRVTLMDRPLEDWGGDLYERIGVSFETPNHFLKLTALENLRYFGRLYQGNGRDPQELLAEVDLQDDGDLLVSQYSKGMQNRLSVARALLNRPDLLFLDEPTNGLDPVNAMRIKDLIRDQQQAGRTVFLTTHNMAVAEELCDRVAFLVAGHIRLIDTPRALRLQYGRAQVLAEFGRDGQVFKREFPLDHLGENDEFLGMLRAYPLQTIHSREASLEEIFIQVTGQSLNS